MIHGKEHAKASQVCMLHSLRYLGKYCMFLVTYLFSSVKWQPLFSDTNRLRPLTRHQLFGNASR